MSQSWKNVESQKIQTVVKHTHHTSVTLQLIIDVKRISIILLQ